MIEYIVRTREPVGEHGFRFPKLDDADQVERAFRPPDDFGPTMMELDSQRALVGDTQIEWSAEMPGWQVTVEGPMERDEADRLMTAVTDQMARECGVPCKWIRISDGDRPVRLPY